MISWRRGENPRRDQPGELLAGWVMEDPLRLNHTVRGQRMSNNVFTFAIVAAALIALAYFANSLVSPFR